ncbi:hypothetical protein [Pseudoalteromonas luteoviolacea]|uniref:hypothetical protein n=1 Tax=Pseudoalteromonas luteoviolacea TaxID=43657 RepID=UPI000A9FDC56|nr:hypothetical protein [Pseudoalteromonas luteoviolacea]
MKKFTSILILSIFTFYGVYLAWFSISMSTLERLGALGSWIGGFSALAALIFAFNEYSKAQIREAFPQRYHMVCKVLPELNANWRDLFVKFLDIAIRIKIYRQKVDERNKFENMLSKNSAERTEQELKKSSQLADECEKYYQEVVIKKYNELKTISDSFTESAHEFQDYFNKIRFSSNYYFKIIESDFDSFKKLLAEAISSQKYIKAELDSIQMKESIELLSSANIDKEQSKSVVEELMKDIKIEDFEGGENASEIRLLLQAYIPLMNIKKDFFEVLSQKLEINKLNFD